MRPVSEWKRLDEFVLKSSGKGSFDCVAARFADGNFAQDDSVLCEQKFR